MTNPVGNIRQHSVTLGNTRETIDLFYVCREIDASEYNSKCTNIKVQSYLIVCEEIIGRIINCIDKLFYCQYTSV